MSNFKDYVLTRGSATLPVNRSDDLLPLVQGSVTKKVLLKDIVFDYVQVTNLAVQAEDVTLNGKLLVVSDVQELDAAYIDDKIIWVTPTGRINVTTGNTCEFAPTTTLVAGKYQIFAGAGTVIGLRAVEPIWWGAKGDDSTDDSDPINAAIACITTNGGVLDFEAKIYRCNITVTSAFLAKTIINLNGATLRPYADADLLTVDSAGTLNHVMYFEFGGGYMKNVDGFTSASAIRIKGTDDNTFNDWHTYHDLKISEFKHGIHATERLNWLTFEEIDVMYSSDTGIYVESAYTMSINYFKKVRVGQSQKHGIHVKNTSAADSNLVWTFDTCNFEGNGLTVATPEISGMLFEDCGIANIVSCYIENNGVGATDGKGCGIRIKGSYGYEFNIKSNVIWGNTYNIENTTVFASGCIKGNRLNGECHIAVGGSSDGIEIGENFGGTWNIEPDANGYYHVIYTSPAGWVPACPASGSTLWPKHQNVISHASNTDDTLSTAADGVLGQLLLIEKTGGTGTLTISHGTGTNNFCLKNGINTLIPKGDGILFRKGSTYWIEVMRSKTPVVLTANLPAASADMDGAVVIEDAGAGDRNIILYAGGQRFRIDGGTNF